MKNLLLVILSITLAGCGVEAADNRADLSDAQLADIVENISTFSVVNVSGEPVNYTAARNSYVINGEAVQVAMVEELAGKAKYAACAACHGNKGQGGIGPMLAGQTTEYISDRLLAYTAGETVGAQSSLMWGQASMLSETDIQDLAEYVQSL